MDLLAVKLTCKEYKTVPIGLKEKKAIVAEVNKTAGEALSAVMADYRGVSVEKMTALRKQAREAGVRAHAEHAGRYVRAAGRGHAGRAGRGAGRLHEGYRSARGEAAGVHGPLVRRDLGHRVLDLLRRAVEPGRRHPGPPVLRGESPTPLLLFPACQERTQFS